MKRIKQFILRHFYVKNSKYLHMTCEVDKKTKLTGKNRVGKHSKIRNTTLGFQSYIGDNCDIENTLIGNYSCISHNVVIVQGQHPINGFLSIHPAFFQKNYKFSYVKKDFFDSYKYIDKENRFACIIGNDVWVGYGAMIMSGVRIGDGAVIAAGSIVTKDVEPFSVVAGVPARKIKQRFHENFIDLIEESKWWSKDETWIKEHADMFNSPSRFNTIIERKHQ